MNLPPTKSWGLKVPGRPPTPSEGAAQHYSRIGPHDSQKILSFRNGTTLSFGPDDPVDEFDEHHPFREQISSINNCIQEIQPFRLRYQGNMNPDKDPDASVWENFRTLTLDPATQQTVTLDSGNYRQVPSRHATYRDTLSVYSNEVHRPGYARRLMDPLGDARFGTGSGAELEQKRELARRAREIIKRDQEDRRNGTSQLMIAGRVEVARLGEHSHEDRSGGPRYVPERFSPPVAAPAIEGPSTAARHDRRQPIRGRQHGGRRGRGSHSRGGRSRHIFNPGPNQPVAFTVTQEPGPRPANGGQNTNERMYFVQGHTFGGTINVYPDEAADMMQHAADPRQEAQYLVQVPVVGAHNSFSRHNRMVPFTAEGMRRITQTNPLIPGHPGAVPQDPSLYMQGGAQHRNRNQYGDGHLGRDAPPSYYMATRQVGLGITYEESMAIAAADTRVSGGLRNINWETYEEDYPSSSGATRPFDTLDNGSDRANYRPSPATWQVDTPTAEHGQASGWLVHPNQTTSTEHTPRFSEISQYTASHGSMATSITMQSHNFAFDSIPGRSGGVTLMNPSSIPGAYQPHLLAPPSMQPGSSQLHENDQFVGSDNEYDEEADEENEVPERHYGLPFGLDRVSMQRHGNMDPVLEGILRRRDEVNAHHELQALLVRRAAANNQIFVPQPFDPRASITRVAAPRSLSASPRVLTARSSHVVLSEMPTIHAPAPRSAIPPVGARQPSTPPTVSSPSSLSPTAAPFVPGQTNEYIGYTVFGQQPGQVSRDPSPRPPRRGGRRLYESRRSTPALLRNISYESRMSSPGPQRSSNFNSSNLWRGEPST